MADYPSALTGAQMDIALLDVAQHNSEAWAVGTRNGYDVQSGDDTFNNNSKHYAEVAKTAAGVAQGAIPSGTAGAVFFDRAQSLTAAQKLQARANIAAGASNRNLLDNPFFTIRQRGTTGTVTTANGFVADRWKKSGSTGSVIIGTNYMNPTGGGGIRQMNEWSKIENGKTYTLSCLLTNGNVYSATGALNSSTSGYQISVHLIPNSLWCCVQNNNGYMDVLFTSADGTPQIRAAKLELGSYSTLINDTPPDYWEEFRKCARYFFRAKGDPLAFGYIAGTNTEAYVGVITAAPMRAQPSVAVSGSVSVRVQGYTHGVSSITSISNPISTGCSVGLKMNLSETASAIGACVVYPNVNSYIDLSADL